jgi:hypothetical protein
MKLPTAVRRYMEEFEEGNEEDVKQYILRQISFYREIQDKATTTEEQWIALKLGCTVRQASAAIKWVRQLPASEKNA